MASGSTAVREIQARYTVPMATPAGTDRKTVTVRVYEDTRDLLNMVAALGRETVADALEPRVRQMYADALAKASGEAQDAKEARTEEIAAEKQAERDRRQQAPAP